MTKLFTTLMTILVSTVCFSQAIELKNGNYYIGSVFKNYPSLYINDGVFTFKKPQKIDSIINLDNKFILPPFAEGHTHKIDNPKELDKEVNNFLKQGVFYALVLNNFSSTVENNRNELTKYNSLDVLFANGGITVKGQHPSFAYERIISGISDWWTPENTEKIKSSNKAENDAYWLMDSIDLVEEKWDAFLATKPDIVKVYIMNVSNQTQDPRTLSESTIKYIVKKAKQSKLRVVAHIESFDDLKVGLRCGINIFGHMPHYNVNFAPKIPEEFRFNIKEIKLIKKLKPVIMPTISFNEDFSIVRNEKNNYQGEFDTTGFNRSLKFQKERLLRLSKYGFKFAIGSDRDFFFSELFYWFKYNIFSSQEILNIATIETPKVIFPNRKLGEFKEGFEASLLVYDKNPLDNYKELKNIRLKIKNGVVLK